MLGVAAMSIGSYCAHADNSATMTVTARIEHDVSLTVSNPNATINIIVNPAQTSGSIDCNDESHDGGVEDGYCSSFIFTANTPNHSSERLSVTPASKTIGTMTLNNWRIYQLSGNDNAFAVFPVLSYTGGAPADGDHNFGEFTISYTPE